MVLQNNHAARLFLIDIKENLKNNGNDMDGNNETIISKHDYRRSRTTNNSNIHNDKNNENCGYEIVKRCVQVINTSLSYLQTPSNTPSNTTSISPPQKIIHKNNIDQNIRARTDVSTDVDTNLKSEKVKTALHFLKRKQKNDSLNNQNNGNSPIHSENKNNGNNKVEKNKISSESGVESFSTPPQPPICHLAFGSRTTPHPKHHNNIPDNNDETPVDYRKNRSASPGSGGQNGPSFHGSGAPIPDKMRTKARGYVWKEGKTSETQLTGPQIPVGMNSKVNSSKNGQDSSTELPPTHRLALYSSLSLLLNALPNSPKTQEISATLGLHEALGQLLRLTGCWASLTNIIPLSTQNQIRRKKEANRPLQQWIPSHYDLVGVVLAVCCAFTYTPLYDIKNLENKKLFSMTGDVRICMKKGDSSSSSNITYQLLSLGQSKGLAPAVRWLCLSMVGSLMRDQSNSKLSAQKQALALTLNTSIQKAIHTATAEPEALLYLIDAYISCICSDNSSVRTDTRTIKKGGDSGDDYSVLPVPELLQWVKDSACSSGQKRPEVYAALMRCMGQMASPSLSLPCRLLANVTSEEPVTMLSQASQSGIQAKYASTFFLIYYTCSVSDLYYFYILKLVKS
jgi:hypothetical protein